MPQGSPPPRLLNRRRAVQALAWPAACTPWAAGAAPAPAQAREAELGEVQILIPGPLGGGWDRGARAIGQALTAAQLARGVAYLNIEGGGGWRGLEEFLSRADLRQAVMVQSVSLVARRLSGVYRKGFRDLRPLACLAEEYQAVVVRPDSPLTTLAELRRQIARSPQEQALVLGSARDSVDHLASQLLLADVPRGPFSSHRFAFRNGDGDATQFLLSGAGVAMVVGFNAVLMAQHQAGQLRILATSGVQRLHKDIPTWVEQGVEHGFANWRGLFARRDMPPELCARWVRALEALMATAAWRDATKANAWGGRFLGDERFLAFLEAEERKFRPLVPVPE